VEMLSLSIALFASTNVDDLFVLVGLFADSEFRSGEVIAGQYIGIAVLFAVSLAGPLLSFLVPRPYMGLLGLVAVALGIRKLRETLRNRATGRVTGGQDAVSLNRSGKSARSTVVILITLANGSDNVAVYVPVFAVHSTSQIVIVGVVFAVMTALWCLIAHSLVNHPTIGAPVRRFGGPLAALVLIGIGILVMYHADSFSLLSH
jgi:cadmium resistance protein CadD (predicted permease)